MLTYLALLMRTDLKDSLIVWNEPREGSKDGVDLAISFQEAQGCSEIWYDVFGLAMDAYY
jgi:hypothetical protein